MWQQLLGSELTLASGLFRLLLGFVAGAVIGAEREGHTSPAGFRTHILICTGATLLMILSLRVAGPAGDPGRIAAQVVSGIGFLGAGAILRFGTTVQGLTSAASIWAVAALGLTLGAGLLIEALVFVSILLIALIVLDRLEKRLFTQRELKIVHIWVAGGDFAVEPYRRLLREAGAIVKNMELSYSRQKDISILKLLVRIPSDLDLPGLARTLSDRNEIVKFRLDQEL